MIEGKLEDFPITHFMINKDNGPNIVAVHPRMKSTPVKVMESGEGWVYKGDWIPVAFFIADILYRLDLQGKLP